MQTRINPQTEKLVRSQGYHAVRDSFIRQASIVLISSSAVLTLFFLFKSIILSVSAEMDPSLASLYYFCGSGSVSVINFIFGILIFLFLTAFTLSVLTVYSGAKNNNSTKIRSGLNAVKTSLIYALILSVFYIIISLCSVSVMYQAAAMGYKNELAENFINIGGFRYIELFFSTVFIGSVVVTSIIFFIRLVISMRHAFDGTEITSAGALSSLIVSLIAALVFFFCSFVALGRLVMPSDIGNSIRFSYVGSAAADIIINASLTTAFTAFALIAGSYTSKIIHLRNMLYQRGYPYATNSYPQAPNRRPYINPVPPQPAPQKQPAETSDPEPVAAESETEQKNAG